MMRRLCSRALAQRGAQWTTAQMGTRMLGQSRRLRGVDEFYEQGQGE